MGKILAKAIAATFLFLEPSQEKEKFSIPVNVFTESKKIVKDSSVKEVEEKSKKRCFKLLRMEMCLAAFSATSLVNFYPPKEILNSVSSLII